MTKTLVANFIDVDFGPNFHPRDDAHSVVNGGPEKLGFEFYVSTGFNPDTYVSFIHSLMEQSNCNRPYKIHVHRCYKLVDTFWKKEDIKTCIEQNKWVYILKDD